MTCSPYVLATVTFLLAVCLAVPVSAQVVEVAPVGGYRFGGDLFEVATNALLDLDGAPVVGGTVSVAMPDGLWFEALFSHQQAHVDIPDGPFNPPAHVRAVVDHWLAGGRQDFGAGRARPFLTGLLGLTHYGAAGDDEVRFTIAGGGGIKLLLARRLGLRLDGRVFTTFVDVDVHGTVCGRETCFSRVHLNVAWQAEFTAGLVLVF